MGRTAYSMRPMEKYLRGKGYHTVNYSYPSTSQTIEHIARHDLPILINKCGSQTEKIHFVTHSLGGIVLRYYLQTNQLPKGSRIVMLSPPNKGSEIADKFRKTRWYKWLTGPAGQQLTTDLNSVPNKLKSIPYDVGIMTGRRTFEPWFSRLIPGEDDGKVSVKRAHISEMKDFLVVNNTHTFIMTSNRVKRQVYHFLKHGLFERHEDGDTPT